MLLSLYIEWTWLHGETVGNQHTNDVEILLSDEKVPKAASQKRGYFYPGSRAGATYWQISDGTFWMFGGEGFDDKPTNEPSMLNDLWEFDTRNQMWRIIDDVDPSHKNEDSNSKGPIPEPRKLAASCGVQDMVFVVFGGEGQVNQILNDTWLYDTPRSEWLHLKLAVNLPQPPGRKDMAYWCHRDKMIIFGGIDEKNQVLHDMWEFSLKALIWTVVEANVRPTQRAGSLTWQSQKGLYMYGGYTVSSAKNILGLNDLWQFIRRNQTWVQLDTDSNQTCSTLDEQQGTLLNSMGVMHGQIDKESPCNSPGGRRHSATWTDTQGDLWLYGGEILPVYQNATAMLYPLPVTEIRDIYSSKVLMAELWRFDIEKLVWLWMGMDPHPGLNPVYGTNYEPGENNRPGARCQMVSWTRKGQMFLYGGLGLDARNKTVYLNDIWLMVHSQIKYAFKVDRDWFRSIPPSTIFMVVLGTFGGIVLAFGVGFYLKKMMESPNHSPSEFKVKYSRVRQDAFYD